VERTAFARAWQFLSYSRLAKWSALIAAVATGILYVGLLVVLGLFADLMVNHGRIPAYRDLPDFERSAFDDYWNSELDAQARAEQLRGLGLDDVSAVRLAKLDPAAAGTTEQDLLWRANLVGLLRGRVNDEAAALMLPGYTGIPEFAQAAFLRHWAGQRPEERAALLRRWGVESNQITALTDNSAELSQGQKQLAWHAYLYDQLRRRDGNAVADLYQIDRTRSRSPELLQPGRQGAALADRGILSLVVRSHGQVYGPIAGWLARIAPWSWQPNASGTPTYYTYLIGLLVVALVLALLRALAMFITGYAAALATIEASNRLRRAIYHHTFRLGTLAFRALGPSEAVSIFTRQLEAVHDGLYTRLTLVFREPVKFVLLLLFALAINVWLALAFLLFALLVWLVGGQLAAHLRRQERVANREAAEQLALLQESMMLMRVVKIYLMELFNQSRVERQLAAYSDAQLRRARGEAVYRPLLIFLGTLAALILLFVAGLIVLSGRLGVASAITMATALVSLYWPVVNWLGQRRLIRRGKEAAVVVFKFLDRPGEVGQAVGAEFLPPLAQQLEFDRVTLLEPGTGRRLLDSVSLRIAAGQRIGLVGPDDMEKHALVYLLPRFLDPNSGEIRIDGHNLRWVTFESLRAQIAMVLQHNLVFNDTVANNIGCGEAGYDLPKIIEAAKMAHAHQFIQKLPRGYETPIGELGHYLNVSERFRIALARAILRDPALLVIEEPTAPLDDDSKDLIDDTFARILPGRTVLFLPHRISTIRACDQVFLLHKGHVEAAGEHRELLSRNQLYRHLQYIEFNEFAEQV
jgi:ATP-binding cassette subfamily B protein